MTMLTIPISDERLQKLKAVAARHQMAAEGLIQLSIDELINRPEDAAIDAMDYVLNKNAELYQRLA